jgi:UDP:flavonoid glycosyltransferase YjiC (YdhE family)
MTRILVTTHAITGHVRHAVPLVRELTAQGHEVLWYTGQMFEPLVSKSGALFAPITARTGFDFTSLDALQAAADRGSGLLGLRSTLRDVFVKPIPAFLEDLRELLDSFDPEVVLADFSFMAGMLLAEQRGLPRVAYSGGPLSVPSIDTAPHGTALLPSSGPLGRLRNRLLYRLVGLLVLGETQKMAAGLREDLGLPRLPGLFTSWPTYVAQTYLQAGVPEFEYPRSDLPPSVLFVGAFEMDGVDDWPKPEWWPRVEQARAEGRKVVFVTQGTAATDPTNLVLPTVEALAGDDVLVIGTTGGRDPEQVLPASRRPANAVLDPFIPFTEIVPLADVMVTNGGFGGVQTALTYGVPLVGAGSSEDHMESNARLKWSGAGVSLRSERQSAKTIGPAVREILADPSYRRRAQELKAAYEQYPEGAKHAAQAVLDAVQRHARDRAAS